MIAAADPSVSHCSLPSDPHTPNLTAADLLVSRQPSEKWSARLTKYVKVLSNNVVPSPLDNKKIYLTRIITQISSNDKQK